MILLAIAKFYQTTDWRLIIGNHWSFLMSAQDEILTHFSCDYRKKAILCQAQNNLMTILRFYLTITFNYGIIDKVKFLTSNFRLGYLTSCGSLVSKGLILNTFFKR
jgi:hypothetical protein